MGIDLRSEFQTILNEAGHYVLLQRSKKGLRCRCWNERYQEPESDCPICNGTGRVVRIERHLARRDSGSQVISKPYQVQQTPIGKMAIEAQIFYLKHDTKPQSGDYIYEVGWKNTQPTHLETAYIINDVQAMRGDRGRIEFWAVSVRQETKDVEYKRIAVRKLGPVKNYEFLK